MAKRALLAVLCGILVLVFGAVGCRFQMPSSSEGTTLASKGVFPGGVPSWVRQPEDGERFKASSSGVIPHGYTTPPAVQINSATIPDVNLETPPSTAERKRDASRERLAGADIDRTSEVAGEDEDESNSPLARIAALCPGMESSVSEALRTEAQGLRIQKYEKLTRACPESEDLWIWLGKDYQSAGMLVQAMRSFERVLVVNSSNEEAQELLASVKKQLNSNTVTTNTGASGK